MMRKSALYIIVVCCHSLLFQSAVGDVRPTCAILTFDARTGISAAEAELLSDRFATEFSRQDRYTIVARSRMREILQEQKFQATDSCSAATCAVEAGRLLGVRYMVFGTIGKLGEVHSINSSLIDVETGVSVRSATTDFRGGLEDFLTQGMRRNALALLNEESHQGFLNMNVFPAHASVTVDGEAYSPGLIPVPANIPLLVVVRAEGYLTRTITQRVTGGETLDLDVRLARSSPSLEDRVASAENYVKGLPNRIRAYQVDESHRGLLLGKRWDSFEFVYGVHDGGLEGDLLSLGMQYSRNIPLLERTDLRIRAAYYYSKYEHEYTITERYTERYTTYVRWGWWYYPVSRSRIRTRNIQVTDEMVEHDVILESFVNRTLYEGVRFRPYVFAGLSIDYYRFDYDSTYWESVSDNDLSIDGIFGLGIQYMLGKNDRTALYVDYATESMLDFEERLLSVTLARRGRNNWGYHLNYTRRWDISYAGIGLTYFK